MYVYFIGCYTFYFYRHEKQTHKDYFLYKYTFSKYYIFIKLKIYCLGRPNCTTAFLRIKIILINFKQKNII